MNETGKTDKVDRHVEVYKELHGLYIRKNHDYGDSFHQSFLEEGLTMARIRLGDKFNRFKTLSKSGKAAVNDESIRDTLLDLANYAIMTVMELDSAKPEKPDRETAEAVARMFGIDPVGKSTGEILGLCLGVINSDLRKGEEQRENH